MKLVLDTNILFSFFRENPVRFVIVNSSLMELTLFTPAYALEELWNNKRELGRYSHLAEKELKFILIQLHSFIAVKPISFFNEYKKEAMRISPDQKDSPFFALALKLKAALWSNEPRLRRQSAVKVLSTQEVLKILKIGKTT
ncbi:hypothetical protein HYS48_01910 [Candidatus Woesearchaeota archaeon]|nr:hypothetical protein [Candidatus Woesearchaeota archaeon]